ncbi:MAG TPA: hypothetical protein DIS79_08570 [Bacteroidetes bacterium]|nr:hypothetical protein [Bacteroidota bacterium]
MFPAPFAPFKARVSSSMMTIVVVLVSLLVVSCSDDRILGKSPNENGPVLSVTEALRQENLDRTIVVRGTIALVCQDEGCWMSITDGQRRLRMTFEDEAFTVPISATGSVIVEGVIHEELVDAASAQAMGPSIGADSVTTRVDGDQRIPLMTARGVKFLD